MQSTKIVDTTPLLQSSREEVQNKFDPVLKDNLVQILSHLPLKDLLTCRSTCKRWKGLIDNTGSLWSQFTNTNVSNSMEVAPRRIAPAFRPVFLDLILQDLVVLPDRCSREQLRAIISHCEEKQKFFIQKRNSDWFKRTSDLSTTFFYIPLLCVPALICLFLLLLQLKLSISNFDISWWIILGPIHLVNAIITMVILVAFYFINEDSLRAGFMKLPVLISTIEFPLNWLMPIVIVSHILFFILLTAKLQSNYETWNAIFSPHWVLHGITQIQIMKIIYNDYKVNNRFMAGSFIVWGSGTIFQGGILSFEILLLLYLENHLTGLFLPMLPLYIISGIGGLFILVFIVPDCVTRRSNSQSEVGTIVFMTLSLFWIAFSIERYVDYQWSVPIWTSMVPVQLLMLGVYRWVKKQSKIVFPASPVLLSGN